MRRMMSAVACVLAGGLVAAQDVKPAEPAQPKVAQPKIVPAQPLPVRPVQVTALKMAQLEEEFETVEAHRDVRKAHVRAAEVGVRVAEITLDRLSRAAASNAVAKEEVERAKLDVELAKTQVEIRLAELKEVEVKVKYAKKRLDDAKLGGVRPPVGGVIRPVPVDPLPMGVADEKVVEELKAKLAKVQAATDKNAAEIKKGEPLLADAKVELAKRIDTASKGRVTPDFLATARAAVDEAQEVVTKAKKERDALETEAAALQKKLKDIEK